MFLSGHAIPVNARANFLGLAVAFYIVLLGEPHELVGNISPQPYG